MMECIGYSGKKIKRSKKLADVSRMQNVWINLVKPTKKEYDEIQKRYKIHPLTIEDCKTTEQRPKMEHFDNYTFILFKALDYGKKERVRVKHMGILLGKNFVITIHPEKFYEMDQLKKRIDARQKRVVNNNVDFLMYSVIDSIVDDYLDVLDKIEDELELLETQAMGHPTKSTLRKIFKMKKVNMTVQKTLRPEREILNRLSKGHADFVSKKNEAYFNDVHDHLYHVIDMNESHKDIVATIMDLYLSSISNQMNEVMKTLTIITALVIIPTLISGIYGMNFKYMPEIHLPYGHYIAFGLMGLSVITMLAFFRLKKWI